MKKYEILLFDLDGTLIDYLTDQEYAVRNAVEKMGYQYSDDMLKEYRKIDDVVWKNLETGEIKTVEELFEIRCQKFFQLYNIHEPSEKFNTLLNKGFQENGTPVENATMVLKKLSQEYQLAIITNGPKCQQNIRLHNAKISEYFSAVFSSEEIGYNKPDIRFFEDMFEKLEEKDKTKMLVIGDSIHSDIQGGTNAGLDTCWYNAFGKKNETKIQPTYEIKNLKELLDIL